MRLYHFLFFFFQTEAWIRALLPVLEPEWSGVKAVSGCAICVFPCAARLPRSWLSPVWAALPHPALLIKSGQPAGGVPLAAEVNTGLASSGGSPGAAAAAQVAFIIINELPLITSLYMLAGDTQCHAIRPGGGPHHPAQP